MKAWVLVLLFSSFAMTQTDMNSLPDETDDPDEQQFINALLTRIFTPLDLELADSTILGSKGFSLEAIELILEWQKNGVTEKGYQRLHKKLNPDDIQLLSGTVRGEHDLTQIVFRQRIQYSPSLEGWRILHKGRVHNDWLSLVFLIEQDPGEMSLSDHSILAVSSDRIPGLTKLLVGDFHVVWGSGLLLDQQGRRMGLSPSSLVKKLRLALTPHYSTRETDYFHGIAGEWHIRQLQGFAFISNRTALGRFEAGKFHEDSDGIHSPDRSYAMKNLQMAGLAGIYHGPGIQVYLATLFDPASILNPGIELGMQWQLNQSQSIQTFTDNLRLQEGRSIISWSYKIKPFQIAVQYRCFQTTEQNSSSSIFSMLGSQALNEQGLSARLQIRPGSRLLLRYSLDTGTAAHLHALSELRRVIQHKAQLHHRGSCRDWQLDWTQKEDGPFIPDDIWAEEVQFTHINKFAVSLNEKISPGFQYRLNLKTASQPGIRSVLIQQRILVTSDSWKGAAGFARYSIPAYTLRLSIYESGLAESFSFFTAYEDGQRWFLYLKQNTSKQTNLEIRIAGNHLYQNSGPAKQLEFSFQLSVVL